MNTIFKKQNYKLYVAMFVTLYCLCNYYNKYVLYKIVFIIFNKKYFSIVLFKRY